MEQSIPENNVFKFDVALEFKEDDGKGGFSACPKDKNVFKLRCNIEKKIVISVTQLNYGRELKIERYVTVVMNTGCTQWISCPYFVHTTF